MRIEALTETRTYSAGIRLDGREPGLEYSLSESQVLLTLFGPVADLDRLSAAPIVVGVNVAGLAPGTHDVPVVPSLPSTLDPRGGVARHGDRHDRRHRRPRRRHRPTRAPLPMALAVAGTLIRTNRSVTRGPR